MFRGNAMLRQAFSLAHACFLPQSLLICPAHSVLPLALAHLAELGTLNLPWPQNEGGLFTVARMGKEGFGEFCPPAGYWGWCGWLADLKKKLQACAPTSNSPISLSRAMARFLEGRQLNLSPIELLVTYKLSRVQSCLNDSESAPVTTHFLVESWVVMLYWTQCQTLLYLLAKTSPCFLLLTTSVSIYYSELYLK